MSEAATASPKPGTFNSNSKPRKGKPDGKRVDKQMATEAKEFAHKALMELRESLSLAGDDARDMAQALASAVKAWQTTRVEWRYAYGYAVPSARRTLPEKPKEKARKFNRPPPSVGASSSPAAPTPQEPT